MRKLILLFTFAPALMFAVDGQILINQSSVMAAGGFPYLISQPGSYKLSGNLVVPAGVDGIHIKASNVTLDLNGFTISTQFSSSSSAGAIVGFASSSTSYITGVTIRNGYIEGFAAPIYAGAPSGYTSAQHWALESLIINFPPATIGTTVIGTPLLIGSFSRIDHVITPSQNIEVYAPSIVAFSSAQQIGCFDATSGLEVTKCAFTGNITP